MPFTFSHPAAVLPFRYLPKHWISMTGLVIGSMSPDFEYFLRMRIRSYFSHTWAGLFWFDLPLTIILAFIFHGVVRDSLIDNLPVFLKKRFSVFKGFNWTKHFKKHYPVVITSIVVGAATHILWDNFTHRHGLFIKSFDGLKIAFTVNGNIILRYKVMQHLSTIIGGLIVIYAVMKLPKHENYDRHKSIFAYWLSVTCVALIVVIARSFFMGRDNIYENLIVISMTGMMVGLVVTPKIISGSSQLPS